MKKTIGALVIVISIVAGAMAFTHNNSISIAKNNCPDRPGCVCSGQSTSLNVAENSDHSCNKNTCPNTPNCICK